ncbi:hypothetical protein MYAM1_001196 [Malassezia yamatoensis]|uniref:DNA replication regulator SLD2 n=1 Tax=Malassezia yamatoensis TaxID=253288 RepID=A0AAJ5YSH1_9BASI|nr:hypothetical protein MYAM1_001196 [Malassezia yamatoensis]
MEALLRKQLKQWQRDFRAKHAREPSKSDVLSNPEIASSYDTWRALNEMSGSSRASQSSTKRASSGSHSRKFETPSTPQKRKKKVAAASPENPFRSPHKQPANYSKVPEFPSCIKQEPSYESDMSDEEPLQTKRSDLKSPSKSPLRPSVAAFTPRTKARKRLRGELIQTPPSRRAQRLDNLSRQNLLTKSPQTKRAIFAATETALDDNPLDVSDQEVFGPSPQKPLEQMRKFRPLFRASGANENRMIESPEKSPTGPFNSSQTTQATLQSTPEATQTSATSQVPPVAPGSQLLELDDEQDAVHSIHILPYRRYGNARQMTYNSRDEMDALDFSLTHVAEASGVSNAASQMQDLSLVSPGHPTSRAEALRRQRNEQIITAIFHETSQQPTQTIYARNFDPDDTLHAPHSDQDWASEPSEAEYGSGTGEIDADDIL